MDIRNFQRRFCFIVQHGMLPFIALIVKANFCNFSKEYFTSMKILCRALLHTDLPVPLVILFLQYKIQEQQILCTSVNTRNFTSVTSANFQTFET